MIVSHPQCQSPLATDLPTDSAYKNTSQLFSDLVSDRFYMSKKDSNSELIEWQAINQRAPLALLSLYQFHLIDLAVITNGRN